MNPIADTQCLRTAGDTLEAVGGALQALVPCALPYALDPALQPQGWLSGRCRVVREPASGTLWVGVTAAAEPAGGAAAASPLSQDALKVRSWGCAAARPGNCTADGGAVPTVTVARAAAADAWRRPLPSHHRLGCRSGRARQRGPCWLCSCPPMPCSG